MAKKLVCLQNFHCNDFAKPKKGDKPDAKPRHKHWQKGDEYTGSDDVDRLLEEGLIGEEAPKGKKGKKTSDELEEDEAVTTEGDEVNDDELETADGQGPDADGEEEAEEEEEEQPKPAPRRSRAKAKPSKKG